MHTTEEEEQGGTPHISGGAGAGTRPLRVAVVGSGVAGLSVAWMLAQPTPASLPTLAAAPPVEVHLFERASRLGMDAEAMDVSVQYGGGGGGGQARSTAAVRVDTPLRVFTPSYYPHLTALYKATGISYEAEDYSASFSTRDGRWLFGYRNWLVGALSIPLLFLPLLPSLASRSCWRILWDLCRFAVHARLALRRWRSATAAAAARGTHSGCDEQLPPGCDVTLAQFLSQHDYSRDFVDAMLLPALCGILTCSRAAVLDYPARVVIEYWCTRTLFGVRRVSDGTQKVVSTLTERVHVHLNAAVIRVECGTKDDIASAPAVSSGSGAPSPCVHVTLASGERRTFDHAVFACQANQALAMMDEEGDNKEITDALKGVRYERSEVLTHSDPSLMPQSRFVWNSVNFVLPSRSSAQVAPLLSDAGDGSTNKASPALCTEGMVSIWLNRCQSNLRALGPDCTPVIQTWNPLPGVRPAAALTLRAASFERPVVTPASLRCLARLARLQGQRRLWFCGSYVESGMPLLETAVTSAVRVARAFGKPPPWSTKDGEETKDTRQGVARYTAAVVALLVALIAVALMHIGH